MHISSWDALIAAKQNDGATAPFSIPLLSEDGATVGSLDCIDRHLCRDSTIIANLTAWRQQAMHCFLTQFTATPERTHAWLVNLILPAKDRVLFLIRDSNNRYIGNIGLCNITENSVEIDNVLRGEISETKNIMRYAIETIVKFVHEMGTIKNIYLHVFSNNQPAINLYKKSGFKKISSTKLIKTPTVDGVTFLMADQSNVDFEYDEMGIDCTD